MLKPLLIRSLRRIGIKIVRIPKDRYRLNRGIALAELDEVLKIAKEETSKKPEVRPTWKIARNYLDQRRISFYCDVVDVLAENQVPLDDRRVIDIGALFGVTLRLIQRRYPTARLHGVECYEKALAVGRRVCPQADIRCETVRTLSFDQPFDLVIIMEVLEHMVDPITELNRLIEFVAPGGYLFMTVPNGRYDTAGSDEFVPSNDSYRGHINFWSPQSWEALLKRVFPQSEVRTGFVPKDYPFNLYGLVRKP